ncbi:MAG: AmmeMemoRadiSam system protein A [Candidatus Micrarchaeia archaeon]
MLKKADGTKLLGIARSAVEARFRGKSLTVTNYQEKRGVFVTITRAGALRGCIGYPLPEKALGESVAEMACAAAFEDPRFPSLAKEELPEISFEISVLSLPEPVRDALKEIKLGRDGLIIEAHGRAGLLLPQVPVEQGWNLEEFLEALCEKAGLARGAWRTARLERFEAQVFRERF